MECDSLQIIELLKIGEQGGFLDLIAIAEIQNVTGSKSASDALGPERFYYSIEGKLIDLLNN